MLSLSSQMHPPQTQTRGRTHWSKDSRAASTLISHLVKRRCPDFATFDVIDFERVKLLCGRISIPTPTTLNSPPSGKKSNKPSVLGMSSFLFLVELAGNSHHSCPAGEVQDGFAGAVGGVQEAGSAADGGVPEQGAVHVQHPDHRGARQHHL